MKICLLANADSVHTRRWVEPLAESGHRVTVLSYAPVKRPIEGVETIDLTEVNNTPRLRFLVWGWWIRQYIRRAEPDLINALQVQAAGWLGVLSRFHPLVVSALGSDLLLESGRSSFRRWLTSMTLGACDRLTVPSQVMLETAKQLGCPAGKIAVVPWGIESDIFCPRADDRQRSREVLEIPTEATVVLCPRAVRPIYNQDVLIESISEIAARAPGVCLVLVRYLEDHEYSRFLEEQISRLGLRKNVVWLEARSTPEEMATLYRMADVVVSIPSSEGYGLTVREAMAAGAATIVSDLPVFESLADRVHTLKVGVGDVRQTSAALLELILDSDLRSTLATAGLLTGERHTAAGRVRRVSLLYEECVS